MLQRIFHLRTIYETIVLLFRPQGIIRELNIWTPIGILNINLRMNVRITPINN